jgi:outer membrane protein assembly factor BamA
MGGDVFYTASALLSMPFPGNEFLAKNGVRLFAFANAGTLTSLENAFSNIGSFVNSSRTAVGGGVSVGTAIGRLEATYAVPLRYAPSDARRSVQAGIGFTFG